jgi:hypothetical protein
MSFIVIGHIVAPWVVLLSAYVSGSYGMARMGLKALGSFELILAEKFFCSEEPCG